jgi:hypothetical protein
MDQVSLALMARQTTLCADIDYIKRLHGIFGPIASRKAIENVLQIPDA